MCGLGWKFDSCGFYQQARNVKIVTGNVQQYLLIRFQRCGAHTQTQRKHSLTRYFYSFICLFAVSSDFHLVDEEFLNDTLFNWVNEERFVAFPKITRSNIYQISQTKKFLVLAVVEENKLNEIASHEMEFRDMVESIVRKYYDKYHQRFQFGWIGTPEIAHSIVMDQLATPHLIVLNTSTYEHYIPDDDPERLTVDAIQLFLHNIHHEKVKVNHS